MNIIIFSVILVICYEILNYLNVYFYFNKQIKLYKEIFINLDNENKFFEISKKSLINSLILLLRLFTAIIPLIIFLIYILNKNKFYEFFFSFNNLVITFIFFMIYFFLRKSFVKRKL